MCPFNVSNSWPLSASQTFTVPSAKAMARRLLSGDQATRPMLEACPFRMNVSSPFSASQTLTVWSEEAVATLPSGLHATPATVATWPFSWNAPGALLPPLPELYRLILTGAGEAQAVGAPGQGMDPVHVSISISASLSLLHAPQLHRAVPGGMARHGRLGSTTRS